MLQWMSCKCAAGVFVQVAYLLTCQLMERGSCVGDFSWIDPVFFVCGEAPHNIGRSCGGGDWMGKVVRRCVCVYFF